MEASVTSPPIRNPSSDLNDTDEARLAKITIFLVAGSCSIAGCIWTLMYYFVFGLGLTTLLPFLFTVIVASSLLVTHLTRNISYAVYSQITCIIYITTFIQWSIGGVFDSGFVLAWATCGDIGALIFFPFRKSVIWFLLSLLSG